MYTLPFARTKKLSLRDFKKKSSPLLKRYYILLHIQYIVYKVKRPEQGAARTARSNLLVRTDSEKISTILLTRLSYVYTFQAYYKGRKDFGSTCWCFPVNSVLTRMA